MGCTARACVPDDRGTYRFDTLDGCDTPSGDVRLPLCGDHWLLAPGHRIRLDLTQVDTPTLWTNNLASSMTFGAPKLVLPTREAQVQTLTGAPWCRDAARLAEP